MLAGLLVLKRASITINTDFYAHPWYYWTYLYNHWLEQQANWADILSPYWSLSVEEQFYVLWPFSILLISRHLRAYFLWFCVFFGIAFRYYSVHLQHGIGVYMLTCVDTFAWGALLAHYIREGRTAEIAIWIRRLIIPVGFCFLMLCLKHTDADLVKQLFFRTFTSLVSAALLFTRCNPDFLVKFCHLVLCASLAKCPMAFIYIICWPPIYSSKLRENYIFLYPSYLLIWSHLSCYLPFLSYRLI